MNLHHLVRSICTTHFNNCELARAFSVSETTVRRLRRLIHTRNLEWDQLASLNDDALYKVFNKPRLGRGVRHTPDLPMIQAELSASGMDLQGWFADHVENLPPGVKFISYSHLAAKLKAYRGKLDLVMRQVHTPGEKVFVDYCGDLPYYISATTGQRVQVQVFVGVLGGSSLLFATATHTQKVPDFIAAHVHMFAYFGGRTDAIVPDNLASAVSHVGPDRRIQRSYDDFARQYDVLVLPARPRTPTDKPKAEAGVKVFQRAMVRLCYRRKFSSLAELNEAIADLVEAINNRKMKGNTPSRRERFEQYERYRLLPLPAEGYTFAEWKTVDKVPKDYHVLVDGHLYSVPHTLVGERVDVRLQATTVAIFKDRTEVARHDRLFIEGKAGTQLAHMPDDHRAQAERAPDMLKEWAQDAGPNITRFVRDHLEQSRPIRGVKAVEDLRKLARDHGSVQVDQVLGRAFERGPVNVTAVRRLLAASAQVKPSRELTSRNLVKRGGASC